MIERYRLHVKRMEKFRLTPDRQAELQRKAVEAYLAQQQEAAERGASIQIEQLQPPSVPHGRLAKLLEKPKPKPRVGRVAAARALNPYSKSSLDLTSQAELEKRDPALAVAEPKKLETQQHDK